MTSLRLLVPALKAVLVAVLLLTLLMQVMSIPGQFAHMAEQEPELAYLQWPLTTWGIAVLLCAQVVVVSIWRLLTLVDDGRIFSEESFRWVDAVLTAMLAAWLLLGGLSLFVLVQADDPGEGVALLAVDLAATVVLLLMVVMRALLRQAAALRADLETVI
jgi:hypothetical protein